MHRRNTGRPWRATGRHVAAALLAAFAGSACAQDQMGQVGPGRPDMVQANPAPVAPSPAPTQGDSGQVSPGQVSPGQASPAQGTPAQVAPPLAGTGQGGAIQPAMGRPNTGQPAPKADVGACLAQLRPQAPANGVSLDDFDRYTQGAQLLQATVAAAKVQSEGVEYWWDYMAKAVDTERVADGREIYAREKAALIPVEDTYQVDGEALVAIFGIETNFGASLGKTKVLDAWLTRACTEGNRLWTRNVYASVRLLRDGTVDPDNFVGSWSGAFGMTQFIPTTFFELAADGDGDGKIDLYHSLPDALASTANHLRSRRAQWTRGLPAVIEVKLPQSIAATVPPGADAEFAAPDDRRSLAQWAQQGVTRADGVPLAEQAPAQQAYLFAPTGEGGPVFLATTNFDAILHYNRSRKYALAVGVLVNRIESGPELATPWPTDDPGLSRVQIRELQTALLAHGNDIGAADGVPGAKTRDAIALEQQRLGLPVDGRPGRRILDALKQQQ